MRLQSKDIKEYDEATERNELITQHYPHIPV